MEKDKIHAFRLIEAIEQDGYVSQRELAKRLNLSLGLVNLFVRRLVTEGYFEIAVGPSKRTIYVLTPKGAAERSRLAGEYFHHCLEFYRGIRHTIRKKVTEIEGEQVRNVILYGAGEIAELVYLCLQGSAVSLVGVIDSQNNGDRDFFGHEIQRPEGLLGMPDAAVLITSIDDCEEKVSEIARNGGHDRMIFHLASAPGQYNAGLGGNWLAIPGSTADQD